MSGEYERGEMHVVRRCFVLLVSLVSLVEQVDVSALSGELLIFLLLPVCPLVFSFRVRFWFLNSLVTSVYFVCFSAINVLHGMSVLDGVYPKEEKNTERCIRAVFSSYRSLMPADRAKESAALAAVNAEIHSVGS